MIWKNIKEKPTQEGIVIVAEFDGDIMVNLHTNWCFFEGHFEPNNRTWSAPIRPTHWMSYADYRKALETLPRE